MKKLLFLAIMTAMSSTISQAQDFEEVRYSPEQTTFTVFAPDSAQTVILRLFDDGTGGWAYKTLPMNHAGKDRYTLTVGGNLEGKFYTFDTSHGQYPGVFAKAVGVNGNRGAVLDMAKTNPEGWESDVRPALKQYNDLVIYEMHHRDFSIDSSSGIRNKGKFLALTEPRAIEHLKKLGINAVHILPSFDYATIDEEHLERNQYNWGYDPKNYNVPEGSYSTDPYNPAVRIKEFKQMVQALHKAGIRVILDVVYNHTHNTGESNFQKAYPGYFYRHKADGSLSDASACGNETASEKDMMRRYMIESVEYWVNEYHIDGFRFDLMGIHDIETMNQIRKAVDKIDPSIFIYGEGWAGGECAIPYEKLAMKAHTKQMPRIAAFSDEMRDGLRGPFNNDEKGGFLAGVRGQEESIKFGIAGGINHPQIDFAKVNYTKEPWTNEPSQMIAYVSCHDDMCLNDRLEASIKGITKEEKIRLNLLAQTAVFTSQGVPFILSGEEMMRDKKGVHNSYCSPDSINHLDWNNLERYPEVFDYYRGLISLRKSHPAFRMGSAEEVRKNLEFLKVPSGVVAYRLKNHAGGDKSRDIIVVLNANKNTVKVSVPKGRYTVVCRNGVISEKGLGKVHGASVDVPMQSALIMTR